MRLEGIRKKKNGRGWNKNFLVYSEAQIVKPFGIEVGGKTFLAPFY